MAKLEVKQEGDKFVLYDDGLCFDRFGLCFDRFDTQEAADAQKAQLEADEKLSDAVSDAVDLMLDSLAEKFPTVSRGLLREMVSDLL